MNVLMLHVSLAKRSLPCNCRGEAARLRGMPRAALNALQTQGEG